MADGKSQRINSWSFLCAEKGWSWAWRDVRCVRHCEKASRSVPSIISPLNYFKKYQNIICAQHGLEIPIIPEFWVLLYVNTSSPSCIICSLAVYFFVLKNILIFSLWKSLSCAISSLYQGRSAAVIYDWKLRSEKAPLYEYSCAFSTLLHISPTKEPFFQRKYTLSFITLKMS